MFALTRLRLPIVVIGAVVFAALLALAAFSSTASATHTWNKYHWGHTGTVNLQLDDNLSANWEPHLATASSHLDHNDWSDTDVLKTSINPNSTNTKRCNPTSGRVEVCNETYGKNGWLGLASVWVSGGHIVQGTAKMNDSYFNTSRYNTPAWRQFVMCQEVGHTFGLGHVNETYNTANTGSCMDYTNDPDGGADGVSANDPSNEYPNQHDYDLLKTPEMYGHADKLNTFSSTSAVSRLPAAARTVDPSDPAQRGRLIHRSPSGGVEIYERDFGGGHKVITRVIRATDGTPALDTKGGGSHNHDDHDH